MTTPANNPPGQPPVPQPVDMNALVAQLQNNALSGTSANSAGPIQNNSIIYFGHGAPSLTGGSRDVAHGMPTEVQGQPSQMSYQDARLMPLSWTPDQIKKFVNQGILNKVPGFNANMGMPDVVSAWDDLVKASYSFNSGSQSDGRKWTPQDVMDTYSAQKGQYGTIRQGDWMVDAATGEKVKYVGATTKTTTSRSINLSSAEDVQAITTQVLTQALGRAPTPKEVAQYKATINAQEKANPTVTTTTSKITPDVAAGTADVTDQSSVTTGGVSAAAQQQLIQDSAQKTQEYAKYQAGTTYYNAMMSMLAGGG
jgi:hypothetical protein